MTLDQLIGVAIFLFGLAFGSFLNVCIYRLPRDLSVVRPGSACPGCGQPIRSRDNIPVLSWLLLGRRCRDCRAPISPRYAAVELLTAGLFVGVYLRFGISLSTVKFCVFAFLILGLIFTDAETKLLPDAMTLPGLVLGIVFSLFVPLQDLVTTFLPGIAGWRDPAALWRWLSLGDSLLGALVGAGFIYGAGVLYLHARGVEGMGFGDVKLMAMVGAFLGMRLTLFTIFLSSLLGAVFGVSTMLVVWLKRSRRRMQRQHESASVARQRAWVSARIMLRHYQMPFGVFLGSVALIAVFAAEPLFRWYWGQF